MNRLKDHHSAPLIYLVIAIFAVSCSSILIRLTHTQPLTIALYRQLFSAVMVLPWVRSDRERILSGRSRVLLILSGLFLALHFATWITGLFYTTVARATLLVDLQPIWAAILGAVFLKESLTVTEALAVGLVTIGGALSVGSHWGDSGSRALVGDLLAVGGGIAGACYLLIGRSVRLQISWLRYMFSVYSISAAWLLLFHVTLYRRIPFPYERDIIWIVLMALIPSILGHGLFNVAIRQLKAYVVNAAFLGEPVLATLLAYFIFGEEPDRFFYIGAVLVFAGLLTLFLRQREVGIRD